jgi:uncharacterized RDD family membrane protein YckC
MSAPTHFSASSKKRIAAFAFDFFASSLLFLCAAVACESVGLDIRSFCNYVFCLTTYQLAFLLFRSGATLGKTLQDIAVVSENGAGLAAWQSVVRVLVRYAPLLLTTVPHKEWELWPAVLGLTAKAFAGFVWLRELNLLQNSPTRQTLADRASRSIVINLPPPHTHRAPAGPMYSATDTEFGVPPRHPSGEAQRQSSASGALASIQPQLEGWASQ